MTASLVEQNEQTTTISEQFLVFGGNDYYPSGGWADYRGSYDTEIGALLKVAEIKQDWWHIVHKGEIIHAHTYRV